MNDFNDTIVEYPKEKTIFGLFEEQVLKTPGAIALQKGDAVLSYAELNNSANKLAHFLIAKGVAPEESIGLITSRDFDMVIGMLAIMKAGGAYVPIDPAYPVDRQEYIFNQSQLKLIVSDNDYPLKAIIGENKFLKTSSAEYADLNNNNPNAGIKSTQLAYTIYTSGSTGRPKGVMIEHHSVVNLILWVNQQFNIGAHDKMLFVTSMCFDLSVYDVFGILAAGGCVVIAESAEIQDIRRLQDMLVKYQVTFWDSVPTTLDYLIRNLEKEREDYVYPGLKTIFLSGDWIPVDLPARARKYFPNAQFTSLGGATEATIWSNFYLVNEVGPGWRSIPYGKPLNNNFFYILDEDLQPVPNGEIGDLYIGGVGVARGYANEPEKTAASFIPDPFNPLIGGVMYRTGDTGRMMPDFNMEFLGRKDNQVKINGFRVELGEIESVLNKSEWVQSAVVLAKKGPDSSKRLLAYIVPHGKFEKDILIAFLKTQLPEYMVPGVWVEMDKMPLNANGKIDRNAMPDFEEARLMKKSFVQPNTPTEKIVMAVWAECMNLRSVSIEDNFFALGGHSLMAVQILTKLEKQFGHSFQLAVLYKYPDIRSLARFIDQGKMEVTYNCLVAIKPSGHKPPLYIIHGEGLNVLNFSGLAAGMDPDRPVFGLQAVGLNGIDKPLDDLRDIAAYYLNEIIRHNPSGPYFLAGYSFGGYVALEIRKQLVAMGKYVEQLIMFDTDAEKSEYKDWYYILPKKVKRNVPVLLSFLKSSFHHPIANLRNQFKMERPGMFTRYFLKNESKSFYQLIKKIKDKHLLAFHNYKMEPFEGKVYLYKANICVHYVYDTDFLGWKKYARGGVILRNVPGDHLSMLLSPNVEVFASLLSNTLNDGDMEQKDKCVLGEIYSNGVNLEQQIKLPA
jgi:amino acid adenylation domain-containing protein